MNTLTPGTIVNVQAAGERQLRRCVVEDRGEIVLITTTEEYEQAQVERREPVSIGFRREWVKAVRLVALLPHV